MTMIKNLTVIRDFQDGTLAEVFKKLGYPAKWKAGERRDLPYEIAQRVVTSGGQLGIQDATAPESKIVEGAKPVEINLLDHYERLYNKGKKIRVVFPEGFRDGSLTAELAAIGHPAEIGVGEILELPLNLLDKIKASGGLFEADPETINQTQNEQGKHQLRVRQWQAEREAEAKRIAERKEIDERNLAINQEIEQLSSEYLTAAGKQKDAIWERMRDLKTRIR